MHNCELSKEKCKELFQKVLFALDGGLNQEEYNILYDEVEGHSCCFDKLSMQKAYKDFMAAKIVKKEVPVELITSIKSKIERITT